MKKKTTDLHPHPKLKHFPMLSEDKYDALVVSIRQNSLLKPIVITSKGEVIDGRNRLKAALEIGLDMVPVEVRDDVDPVVYAIESAATGRQLTKTGVCLLLLDQHPDLVETRGAKAGRKAAGEIGDSITNSFRDIGQQYQVPREYFTYILKVKELCRNQYDEERLEAMVYELEVSAINLEKGMHGWQASHPIDEKVSKEAIHMEPPPKRKDPNPFKIMDTSFHSVATQAENWNKIDKTFQSLLRDRFVAMWKALPDELKKAVR